MTTTFYILKPKIYNKTKYMKRKMFKLKFMKE